MESYKREFIQFLEKAGVLRFGDFTAKSGRKIPYFINAGMIKTGDQITKMGQFYARAYLEKLGIDYAAAKAVKSARPTRRVRPAGPVKPFAVADKTTAATRRYAEKQ